MADCAEAYSTPNKALGGFFRLRRLRRCLGSLLRLLYSLLLRSRLRSIFRSRLRSIFRSRLRGRFRARLAGLEFKPVPTITLQDEFGLEWAPAFRNEVLEKFRGSSLKIGFGFGGRNRPLADIFWQRQAAALSLEG
jgi:hypothetical protein